METRKANNREKQIMQNIEDSKVVIDKLAEIGINVSWISDLYSKGVDYRSAIPLLIEMLPVIDNLDIKEAIVRALAVKWAKPIAAKPLILEFHRPSNQDSEGLKWAIGNSLEVVATDEVYDDMVRIAVEKSHGIARQMVVLGLGKMKNPEVIDVLISLLNDDEVNGHAISALRKLKAVRAVPHLEALINHKNKWISTQAKNAIQAMK